MESVSPFFYSSHNDLQFIAHISIAQVNNCLQCDTVAVVQTLVGKTLTNEAYMNFDK